MDKTLFAGAALGALLMASVAAQAGIVRTFSGSGTSGFLDPAGSSEPWTYGNPGGVHSPDVGWGSPGVTLGLTASNETVPVSDFEITFASPLDPAAIASPNCGGGTTAFCTLLGGLWTTNSIPPPRTASPLSRRRGQRSTPAGAIS